MSKSDAVDRHYVERVTLKIRNLLFIEPATFVIASLIHAGVPIAGYEHREARIAAIAFVAVFVYLAAAFDYPDVLDGTADQALPALFSYGRNWKGRVGILRIAATAIPACWRRRLSRAESASEGWMRLAMLFAVISSVASMLGLMSWPLSTQLRAIHGERI